MTAYLILKHFHVSMAVVSGAFFFVRGCWMLAGSSMLRSRWVRLAPHIIDTALLASAIGLATWSRQYPGQQGWLSAKLAALVLYIILGSVALKRGRTLRVRALAFFLALLTYAYILGTALTRNPAWPI